MSEKIATNAYQTLKRIPKKEWITNSYYDENSNKCCAMGWFIFLNVGFIYNHIINRSLPETASDVHLMNEAKRALFLLSRRYLSDKIIIGTCDYSITSVNDHKLGPYREDHPKDRVLHLLKDMIRDGYEEIKEPEIV